MTSKYFVGALIGALIVCCLPVQLARAATVYSYAGNNFSSSGIQDVMPPNGAYTTSMSVTGSFTLQNALSANLTVTDITANVLDFSFSDGRSTITKANAATFGFIVITDALANITQWALFLRSLDSTFPTVVGSQRHEIISNVNTDSGQIFEIVAATGVVQIDTGSIHENPGTWSVVATPLPAALPLFATGVGALGLIGWRRKKKAAALAA